MSTLGHQYDNSLVSNVLWFLRLPMNFQPYDSDADWVSYWRAVRYGHFWSCGCPSCSVTRRMRVTSSAGPRPPPCE